MKTQTYFDVAERLEFYRASVDDPETMPRIRKFRAAQMKKLERYYLRDITETGLKWLIDAKPPAEHVEGRWAVYFIHAPLCGRVKIGTTRFVVRRMRRLCECAPEPYVHLGWIPGGTAIERGLHKRLAAHRKHGEWFDVNDEICAELHRFGIRLAPPRTSI